MLLPYPVYAAVNYLKYHESSVGDVQVDLGALWANVTEHAF